MFRSVFSRLMAMVLSLICIIVLATGLLAYSSMRDERVNTRMEELKRQAYDIAYLASRADAPILTQYLGDVSETTKYIAYKADQIYRDYGAVMLVLDRQWKLLTNVYMVSDADSFDVDELKSYLYRVLEGEEIVFSRADDNGKLIFTVAVPWIQEEVVLGAVVIQTSAQTVEAMYRDLGWQISLIMILAFVISSMAVYVLAKRFTQPVRQLTAASKALSMGDFSKRVDVNGDTEIDRLAQTFNSMSQSLENVEMSRREFVANVSHELRSPITSIQGFVQGMLDGLIPPEEYKHYLTIVSDEAKRMTSLISDLLALSRMETDGVKFDMARFDVNEVLRRVLIAKEMKIEQKRLNVDIQFEEENLYCNGSLERIEQVALNLIDNAIKFLPDEGTLTLISKTIGKTCFITVKDNGCGILPEDRPHVFERFYKGDKAHVRGQGTGLGLSICQRIMQIHGQSIYLEDTDVGTAITFTLERAEAPEAAEAIIAEKETDEKE